MTSTADQDQPTIKPAQVSLSPLSAGPELGSDRGRWRQFWIWSGFAVLAALVFAVMFILPGRIEPISITQDQTDSAPAAAASAKSAAAAGSAGSPWTEAQLAKQRKDTQEVLSELLKQQEALESLGVKLWAADDYSRALQLAQDGDAKYRERRFMDALNQYQAGLDELNRLLARADTIFTDAVRDGYRALEDGNTAAAQAAFQLARTIKPADTEAGKGMARAETLDQVLELLRQGDDLLAAGNLEQSITIFQQAATLDPDHGGASERLARAGQMVSDREFTAAMSRGYAALAGKNLQQARAAFQGALKIKPQAQEARDALHQAEEKITTHNINILLAEAERQEQAEHWSEAVSAYEQALKIDANLTAAQNGRRNAAMRADLDQRLSHAIDNPLRLSEHSVHSEASALSERARQVAAPGPRLQGQIANLQKLLEQAQSPLPITIQSDNYTEVTLYRTGNLGRFLTTRIDLLPGQYIAVGKRQGYQDVRVEFTVMPGQPLNPVLVQCDKKITL